ncbi:GLPGLI family protein [Epilithonimonas hispanica]|uniref:GLPGLI family protein n=1 Tax=Epilithonimonas hispanica TaxID=358687 RepID=A0A3D9CZM2_9FLAO|nr:GLPGLI family protein [Epilithonimonas hispanica]REC71174.1 GLPGLI family protein [Epilithonimonas hispanica]
MKSLILQLLLFSELVFSQSTHRFFYELKFKNDSTSTDYVKDFYVLDISKDDQKFYNYEFLKNDSISKSKINQDYIFSETELDIRLVHKKNNEFYNYYSQTPLYYLLKTNDKQNWNITTEKKIIGKYNVQKATTKFGGRNWEAWFSSEIPLFYGPYKFYGLPGLILELADTKQNYIFTFKGNKNIKYKTDTSTYIEALNTLKPLEVSQKQYDKLQMDYFLSPLKDFGEGGLIIENEKGEMVQANSKDVTEQQQSYLRKFNNPIEVDKAIHYPEK